MIREEKAVAPHSSTLAWKIPGGGAWWAAVHGVAKSWTWLSDFAFTFHFHALKKEMATHSSVLAWGIPGTGEPGGLPSLGLHRVGHDWSDLAAAAAWLENLACVIPYLWNALRFVLWTNIQAISRNFPFVFVLGPCYSARWCGAQALSRVWICSPMDCSLSGSSIHGIFQARILEWGAISYFSGSSWSRYKPMSLHLLHWQANSLLLVPRRKP